MPHPLRVARVLGLWVRSAGADLVKEGDFLRLLTEVQDQLLGAGLKAEHGSLNAALSGSMKSSAMGYNSPGSGSLRVRARE